MANDISRILDEVTSGATPAAAPARSGSRGDVSRILDDIVGSPAVAAPDERLTLSLKGAQQLTPDQWARGIEASRKAGLPIGIGSRNPEEAARMVTRREFEEAVRTAPAIGAAAMRDPNIARLMQDDLRNVVDIELQAREMATLGPLYRRQDQNRNNILRGLGVAARDLFPQMLSGSKEILFGAMGDTEDAARASLRSAELRARGERARPTFENLSGLDRMLVGGAYAGAESAVQNLPGLVAGMAAAATGVGAVGVTAAALAPMFAQVLPTSFSRASAQGLSFSDSLQYGLGQAAVETLTEIPAIGFLAKRMGKEALSKLIGGYLFRDIGSEQIATLAGDALDTAFLPGMTWDQYFSIKGRGEAAIQTLIATVVGGGAMAGVVKLAEGLVGPAPEAERAIAAGKVLQDMSKFVAASKVRQRDATTMATLLQSLQEENGAPTTLYLDSNVLTPEMQQQLEALMPSVAAQRDEIVAGAMIELPVGELLTQIAGTPLEQQLVPELRTDENALSVREAETFYQSQSQAFEAAAQKLAEQKTQDTAWNASAKELNDTLTGMFTAVPTITRDQARAYVAPLQAFYTTLADKLGIAPAEAYSRYKVTLSSEQIENATLTQEEQAFADLQGLPATVKVDGRDVTFGTLPAAADAAVRYMRAAGLPYAPPTTYAKVDPDRARRIAEEFDKAEHRPNDPEVAAAYDAMVRETLAQYQAIKATGLKVEFITDGKDPYGNPRNAILDVRENNHLWVFATADGFGSSGFDPDSSPMLQPTNEVDVNGVPMLVNDVFRVVHDYFGHIKHGVGFRADGEENAWRAHAAMYSPLARRAMTTETRGQNSWVNFGPFAEQNKTAGPADTVYADQKVTLLPEWVSTEGAGAGPVLEQRVGTRFPTGAKATEDPVTQMLRVGLDELKQAPAMFEKVVAAVKTYVNFPTAGQDLPTEDAAELFIEEVRGNLLWLFDQVPDEVLQRSRLWYDGGRAISEQWAEEFGIPVESAAAAIATLSPQKDWFANVALARRVIDVIKNRSDFAWSPEMEATAARIFAEPKYKVELDLARGKTFRELPQEGTVRALWLRAYDEAHNPRGYPILSPEGQELGPATNLDGAEAGGPMWSPLVFIQHAINVVVNASPAVISDNLGAMHKVRNFYNNIFDPNSPDGEVTIDTHAVAAALLRPLAGSDLEVAHNLGSSIKGVPGAGQNANLGLSGTYALYAEAYRRAAADRGVLPREMQSITWEAVRGLFAAKFKTKKNKAAVTQLWQNYKDGKATLDETRAGVLGLAGGISPPTWYGRDDTGTAGSRPAGDGGGVSGAAGDGAGVRGPGAGAGGARRRRGVSGVSGGTLNQGSARPVPEYGVARDGATSVFAIHYSPRPQTRLESSKYGTGMQGAERARVEQSFDDRIRQRIHFYVDGGNGIRPENAVGGNMHWVRLNNVYDVNEDALGIWASGGDLNAREGKIIDAGFDGYVADMGTQRAAVLLGKHSVAVEGGTLNQSATPAGFREDLGRPAWLAEQIEEAQARGRNRWGVPYMGKVTGSFREPVQVPVSLLAGLKGQRDEQNNVREESLQYIRDNWDEVSKEPPYIEVAYNGEAWVSEGNHRIMVAAEKGLETLAVEIRYFDGGQRNAGPLAPENVAPTLSQSGSPQVDTPAFKEWFGDSKVVDRVNTETGLPVTSSREPFKLVPTRMFHTTRNADFTAFEAGRPTANSTTFGDVTTTRAAIFFTESVEDSNAYAEAEGSATIPVYLKAENPLDLTGGVSETAAEKLVAAGLSERFVYNRMGSWDMFDGEDGAAVVAAAKAAGYDAIVFNDQNPVTGDSFEAWAVFEPTQIKSAIGNAGTFDPNNPSILRQDPEIVRGQISFAPDIASVASRVTLLKDADMSTFLHEMGHFMLEVYTDIASKPNPPPEIVKDLEALLKWMGFKGTDDQTAMQVWTAASVNVRREYHETFARGFEAYLREGNAPTVELQSFFSQFRSWLVRIYKTLTQLNVKLSPEVRQVMDRMLASEQQIDESRQIRSQVPLFASAEELGMNEKQWADYQALNDAQREEAISDLQARSIRNMQWLGNARSREMRKLQKKAAEIRKEMEPAVLDELRKQPVYAARRFLSRGLLPDGGQVTGAKLSLPALKEMYGDAGNAPWRYLSTGKFGLATANEAEALHPDAVAGMFGFTSGDHLVRELLAARPESEEAQDIIDRRMLEEYSDLTDEASMNRAVDSALANEARGKFLATELAALTKTQAPIRAMAKAAKEWAAKLVSAKKIRDIRPGTYSAAEAKEGRHAMNELKLGNTERAAIHKRNQLLQHHAARTAADALEEVEKAVAYLKKFNSPGVREKIDQAYLDQIDKILEKFDLRQMSLAAMDKRAALSRFVAALPKDLELDLPDYVQDDAQRVPYRELTLEDFRGVVDSIKMIDHLGRLKEKLLTAKEAAEFQAVVDEISTSIDTNGTKIVQLRQQRTLGKNTKNMWRGFLAGHRKMSSLFKEMDGSVENGPLWRYIIEPMNTRSDMEATMRAEASAKLRELFAGIRDGGKFGGGGIFLPGLNLSLNREERISVALNVGNEGNLQRLLNGQDNGRGSIVPWTPLQVQEVLDTLTESEWKFVQGVWDFFESYKPLVAAKQRRVTGVEPEWVVPTPVTTPFGVLRGGYFPIVYDTNQSIVAGEQKEVELAKQQMKGAARFATTRRGHVKERAESVKIRPLLLSLDAIGRNVNDVIHDLTWHEWLIDTNRLLKANPIGDAILHRYGTEVLSNINSTVLDIATGDNVRQTVMDPVLNHLRAGSTIVGMGWSLSTAAINVTGFASSVVRIGPEWMLKGLYEMMGSPSHIVETRALVHEKSEFMQNRARTLNREINDVMNTIVGDRSDTAENFRASFFWMITKTQEMVDLPTWLGAYNKATAQFPNDDEKAVALADQAVRDAQGAGQTADLAPIQRGSASMRLFTTFYSYMNTQYNLAVDVTKARTRKGEYGMLAVDYLVLLAVPAMMTVVLKTLFALSAGDDWDEEKFAKKMAAEFIAYPMSMLVGFRELAAAGQFAAGVNDFGGGYPGPAGLRAFAEMTKLGQQIGQGEPDMALLKAAINTGGILLHFPGGQVARSIEGAVAMAEDEASPLALLFGPPRD